MAQLLLCFATIVAKLVDSDSAWVVMSFICDESEAKRAADEVGVLWLRKITESLPLLDDNDSNDDDDACIL